MYVCYKASYLYIFNVLFGTLYQTQGLYMLHTVSQQFQII